MNIQVVGDTTQDRLVDELYAWIAVDPRTTLEGLAAIGQGSMTMQAVTSSRATAEKLRPIMLQIAKQWTAKKFKLVRFKRAELVEELRLGIIASSAVCNATLSKMGGRRSSTFMMSTKFSIARMESLICGQKIRSSAGLRQSGISWNL